MARSRLIHLLLLFVPTLVCAQAGLVDTTYHENGRVASVSWYSQRLSRELSRSEAFQRGLPYGVGNDTIYMRDSVWIWDPDGKRMTGELPADAYPPPKKREVYSESRPPESSLFSVGTRFHGYQGVPVSVTVRLANGDYGIALDTVRLFSEDSWMEADTVMSFRDALRLGVPATITPGAGSRRVTVLIQGRETREVYRSFVTLEGYDLGPEDFTDTAADATTVSLSLQERDYLYMKLTGNRKLLSVLLGGEVITRLPVGRVLDQLAIKGWTSGRYVLRLSDLGTGTDSFARLNLY